MNGITNPLISFLQVSLFCTVNFYMTKPKLAVPLNFTNGKWAEYTRFQLLLKQVMEDIDLMFLLFLLYLASQNIEWWTDKSERIVN